MPKTLEEIQEGYRRRLILPEFPPDGDPLIFTTGCELIIAHGYERVVIGMRGPYVEFLDEHIKRESLFIPGDQRWRFDHFHVGKCYYYEFRTRDSRRIKVYFQKKPVDYADYRIGRWYISPFDLVTDQHPVLVEPLRKEKHDAIQEAQGRDGQAVRKEDVGFKQKARRGIVTGGHVLHLTRRPAFDAANRYSMPDIIPLNWEAFIEALTEARQGEKENG